MSSLTMTNLKGKGIPVEYENGSQALTYVPAFSANCVDVWWNLGKLGLCTDELATC